jgi:hypothetical protein
MRVNLAVHTSVLPSIELERQDRRQPTVGGVVLDIDKLLLSISNASSRHTAAAVPRAGAPWENASPSERAVFGRSCPAKPAPLLQNHRNLQLIGNKAESDVPVVAGVGFCRVLMVLSVALLFLSVALLCGYSFSFSPVCERPGKSRKRFPPRQHRTKSGRRRAQRAISTRVNHQCAAAAHASVWRKLSRGEREAALRSRDGAGEGLLRVLAPETHPSLSAGIINRFVS